MDVILLEHVEKLGQMGDIVSVRNGFARNYLLPRRKALRATRENIADFETRRTQYEAQNLERRQEADAVGVKLDGLDLVVIRQASENGHLYGSVTTRDVSQGVTEAGFTIDRRQVEMPGPIKTLGIHDIRIMLHPEVVAAVRVNVARSQEEAKAQAAQDGELEGRLSEPFEDGGNGGKGRCRCDWCRWRCRRGNGRNRSRSEGRLKRPATAPTERPARAALRP